MKILLNTKDIILSKYQEELGLSNRAINVLKREKIKTGEQLLDYEDGRFGKLRNIGVTTAIELIQAKKLLLENNIGEEINNGIELNDPKLEEVLLRDYKSVLGLSKKALNYFNENNVISVHDLITFTDKYTDKNKYCNSKVYKEAFNTRKYLLKSNILKEIDKSRFKDWQSLIEFIKSCFNNNVMNLNKRALEVLKDRYGYSCQEMTLEEAGRLFSVTRERIRQIQMKFEKKISERLIKNGADKLVDALDRVNSFEDLAILENNDCEWRVISELINKLDIGINIYPKYKLILKGINLDFIIQKIKKKTLIGKLVERDELIILIKDVFNNEGIKETQVRFNAIFNVADNCIYHKVGKYYSLRKITLMEISEMVIKEKFPDGINLYENWEELSQEIKKDFPELSKEIMSQRAIVANALRSNNIILWGWGKYIHIDHVKVDKKLLDLVVGWIVSKFKSNMPSVSTNGAFCEYKEKCINACVPNEHALYSLLRIHYPDKFNYLKDPIILPKTKKFKKRYELVEEYLMNQNKPVQISKISKDLGIRNYQFTNAFGKSENIFMYDRSSYLHRNKIKLNKSYLDKLVNWLYKAIDKDSHVNVRKVAKENPAYCDLAGIKTDRILYRVLSENTDESVYFPKYPIIMKSDDKTKDKIKSIILLITEYFDKYPLCSYEQLIDDFVEKRGYLKWTIDNTLTKLSENLIVRYTSNEYVTLNFLNWNGAKTKELTDIAENYFSKQEKLGFSYVYIYDLLEQKLPILGNNCLWQFDLLVKMLEKINSISVFDKIYIIKPNINKNECLADILKQILLNEFGGATNINEFENYLKDKMISNSIPDDVIKNKTDIKVENEVIFLNVK